MLLAVTGYQKQKETQLEKSFHWLCNMGSLWYMIGILDIHTNVGNKIKFWSMPDYHLCVYMLSIVAIIIGLILFHLHHIRHAV